MSGRAVTEVAARGMVHRTLQCANGGVWLRRRARTATSSFAAFAAFARTFAVVLAVALASIASTGSVLRAQGTMAVRGIVLGRADSTAVLSAAVRVSSSGLQTRTDESGRFEVSARRGDTLVIRALGFRDARVVVREADITTLLDALATVLPVFTTTVGQRVIRANESTRSVTVLDRRSAGRAG